MLRWRSFSVIENITFLRKLKSDETLNSHFSVLPLHQGNSFELKIVFFIFKILKTEIGSLYSCF